MSYYLFGNITNIVNDYYSDIPFKKIVEYDHDGSLPHVINLIKSRLVEDNYYKDCDYLVIYTHCGTMPEYIDTGHHVRLLLELDGLLKYVRYMLVSSAFYSTFFDTEVSLCKNNFIRMHSIFEGLNIIRDIARSPKEVPFDIEQYMIQSLCSFDYMPTRLIQDYGDRGCVGNIYYYGLGRVSLSPDTCLYSSYTRPITQNMIDYAFVDGTNNRGSKMLTIHGWLYGRAKYYKEVFTHGGDSGNSDDYAFVFCKQYYEKNDIESRLCLAGKKYIIYYHNMPLNILKTNHSWSHIFENIFDESEYKTCMIILMSKCAKLYSVSCVNCAWEKVGLVDIMADFYGRDVVRVAM